MPVSSDDSSPKEFFTSSAKNVTDVKPLCKNQGPGMYTTEESESDTESSVTSSATTVTSSLRYVRINIKFTNYSLYCFSVINVQSDC